MGSTGSGRFGTYSGGGAGAFPGVSSGGSEFSCPLELLNVKIEDVGIGEYYTKNGVVPPVATQIILNSEIVNGRLVVVSLGTNQVIGNIPVEYNYLNLCMKKGMIYKGGVISSGIRPIPYVVVNLYA